MSIFRTLLVVSLMMVCGGAAFGQSVTSTYDKEYGLSRLQTYDFKVEERDKDDPLAANTLTERKIKDALDEELQNRGYHPQSNGAVPGFLISFHVRSEDKTDERGRGRGYVQGTLIVDFRDAETKKLVWRGVASGAVGADAIDLKLAEEKVKEAAKLLLEQFGQDVLGF